VTGAAADWPGVLMVTGAYLPELSGGGLQCRTMIQALGDRIRFRVLTTCTDPALSSDDLVEGVPVTRVYVDVARPMTKVLAALRMVAFFASHRRSFDVVHLHGFSQKSVLVALLARVLGKILIITIHTAEHDEAEGVRRLGALAYWCYAHADRFVAISPRLAQNYRQAGLPADRLRVAANGVDTSRFRPASPAERETLKREIGGLPADVRWILFVGFFSRDKGPDVLFDAWLRLSDACRASTGLLFVGAHESAYHEVEARLARQIRDGAAARGLGHLVHFAGLVSRVERVYRAADLFVMPSAREAFGMVLAEAMASGLPVVASRIDGVTSDIVEENHSGLLVPPRDAEALARAMEGLLADPVRAAEMGAAARARVVSRYGLEVSTARWLELYREAGLR